MQSSAEGPIVTVPGSHQSESGCTGDWAPDCLRSWLQDIDGDGTYTFVTDDIPTGDYAFKVALDEAMQSVKSRIIEVMRVCRAYHARVVC